MRWAVSVVLYCQSVAHHTSKSSKICMVIHGIFNVWERIGDKALCIFLHNSRERGSVYLIFLPDLAGVVN